MVISEHLSRDYRHINFHILFLSSKPQMQVSQRVINFIEVMEMARTITANVAFPLTDCVSSSKYDMTHMPSFPMF